MSYAEAKAKYVALGVDTDAAIAKLKNVPVALHCWQGDDVRGFDTDPTKPLTGGIQTTGNYPGRARTPEELMADLDMVLKLCPGTKKLNLHACYAIFEDGEWVDRDKLEPKHFKNWVDFCKERGLGCDFNPTFFSHPKANGLTLSSPDEEIRRFWIEHGKACIRISNYLAEELGQPCVMNIWTGDLRTSLLTGWGREYATGSLSMKSSPSLTTLPRSSPASRARSLASAWRLTPLALLSLP